MERFLGEPREELYREGLDRLAEWEARLRGRPAPLKHLPSLNQMDFHPNQTRGAYLDRVRRCTGVHWGRRRLHNANLSHRFTLQPPSAYNDDTGIDSPTSRNSIDVSQP